MLAYFLDPNSPITITEMPTSNAAEVMCNIDRPHSKQGPLVVGYEVFRFGVPMIGEYMNVGGGRRVTISPAVPGAQYRIEAWALSGDRRNVASAVKNVRNTETSKLTNA